MLRCAMLCCAQRAALPSRRSDGQAQLQAQGAVHQEQRQDGGAKVGVQAAGVRVVLQVMGGVNKAGDSGSV